MNGAIPLEMKTKNMMKKNNFISNYCNNLKRELADLYHLIKSSKTHINLIKLKKCATFIFIALSIVYFIYFISVNEVGMAFFLSLIVATLITGVLFLINMVILSVIGIFGIIIDKFQTLFSTFHIILWVVILLFTFLNFEYK